jgi:predicted nucleic acid-binding protein
VKISAALQGVSRLFLDTAPVVYYVERNPTYSARADEIFDRIDAGSLQGVTSGVTLAECLVGPVHSGLAQVQRDFIDVIVGGANTTFVALDATIAQSAAELRVKYGLGLADAFQIAAAIASGCGAFLTNDRGLTRVKDIPVLVLDDLEL